MKPKRPAARSRSGYALSKPGRWPLTLIDAVALKLIDARHLKTDAEINEFERFYKYELDHVSSFAFPHHGSIENSNPDRLVSNADYWVASADPIHDWLHPHPSLQAAAVRKGKLRWVRSTDRSAFDEAVLFARSEAVVRSRCSIRVSR